MELNKHIWIKKATGLGVTEFMLRYMAWLCLNDAHLVGKQMCIVTGPRIELAITLINRMKRLFERFKLSFDTKETVIELNGVHIEAYPSHHLDSMRGLTNVSFIYIDKADFFPPGQQQDARDVSERYIAKSNPWIVMVSTPNAPDGLFEKIESEPEGTCLYKRMFFDYTYGLDKIYTREEIVLAQKSPSFEREYNLKQRHHITKIYVDGANPEVIRELKRRIGEYHDYYGRLTEEQIWALRSSNSWQIIPVNFQKRHREMLQWTYALMSNNLIKIHPSLQKLIISLRTAIVSDVWKLDKQQTSHHDTLDSFRLALCNYEFPKNNP